MDTQTRTNHISVDNETESHITRTTADGRLLTYTLRVLQQPVRARACGQGAKSSADRRPVDPPPIVELKIFQGEKREEDITFTMNANYFLFATLEQARPMAHGRVSHERTTPPVLTGTPVAGMVYLDRPNPAGYFIFPDLSVRHEGRYRLSFSLYEELKHSKDEDKADDPSQMNPQADQHVTHRLDVRSEPFHVFSAKKFPGLTESTSLSRMVAEQGCRVRIRRDVRMRRRETKGGKQDWDDYEDETAAARARQQSATPDPSMYSMVQTPHTYMDPVARPRSTSNTSHHSMGTNISRRPSLQDIGQSYPQSSYGTAPQTPQHQYPPQQPAYSQSQAQQYQQPQQFAPPPPQQQQQQQQHMQPPPPYQAQNYPAPPVPTTTPQNYYSYGQAPPPPQPTVTQSQYSAPPPQQQQQQSYAQQVHPEYRRASMPQHIPPPPPPPGGYSGQIPQSAFPQLQPNYSQPPPPPPQASHTSPHQPMDLFNGRPPHLEPLQPPARATGATTPMSAKPSFDLPPINTAMMPSNKIEASSPMSSSAPQSSYFGSASADTHKRSFGNVFSDRHQNGPLRQGARPSYGHNENGITHGPSMPGHAAAADDDDDTSGELDPETLGMHYRRADGRQILRALPGHI